jgi:hypothetical protein
MPLEHLINEDEENSTGDDKTTKENEVEPEYNWMINDLDKSKSRLDVLDERL